MQHLTKKKHVYYIFICFTELIYEHKSFSTVASLLAIRSGENVCTHVPSV